MPYKGSFDSASTLPSTISLREAAKIQQRDKVKCNCNGTCKKGRCSCRNAGLECTTHCHPKSTACLNKDCLITKVEHPDGMSKLAVRKHKLELKSKQKGKHRKIATEASPINIRDLEDTISNHRRLQDSHINAANSILKNQFPKVSGLYNPQLGVDLTFPPTVDSFIQILHVGGNHWMTVAGGSTQVHVYDSIYSSTQGDTKMQIAAILCSPESSIRLKIHKVQFQKGALDCGLYAIAYATDLVYGNDPASYIYKQEELGAHFLDCIHNNILSPFPKDNAYPGKPKFEHFEIFCSCRLPDNGEERMGVQAVKNGITNHARQSETKSLRIHRYFGSVQVASHNN